MTARAGVLRVLSVFAFVCVWSPMVSTPVCASPRPQANSAGRGIPARPFAGTWKGRITSACSPSIRKDTYETIIRVSPDEKTVWDRMNGRAGMTARRTGDTLTYSGRVPNTPATFTCTLRLGGAKSARYAAEMQGEAPLPGSGEKVRCVYTGAVTK